jgi:hypothetical protein
MNGGKGESTGQKKKKNKVCVQVHTPHPIGFLWYLYNSNSLLTKSVAVNPGCTLKSPKESFKKYQWPGIL